MLPSPPDVMPGELASERADSEHGHERNQFQRGAHDLAKVAVRPGKCTPCYSNGVVLAHWDVPFRPTVRLASPNVRPVETAFINFAVRFAVKRSRPAPSLSKLTGHSVDSEYELAGHRRYFSNFRPLLAAWLILYSSIRGWPRSMTPSTPTGATSMYTSLSRRSSVLIVYWMSVAEQALSPSCWPIAALR